MRGKIIAMAKKKILFINQEISPYVPDNNLSLMGKSLPQAMQERNHEIQGGFDPVGQSTGVLHR